MKNLFVLASFIFFGAGCATATTTPSADVQTEPPVLSDKQVAMVADLELSGEDQDCPETTDASTQRYEIIDQCLYRDGKRVFVKSLPYMMVMGEFGQAGIDQIYFPMYAGHALGSTQDWFWFTSENKTYFYFRAGGRSCQGCEMPGGPRLIVDEADGSVITKEVVADFPPPSTLILSPDYTRAAQVVSALIADEGPGGDKRNGEIVFEFTFVDSAQGEELYTVPVGQTLVSGCYNNIAPCVYDVTWIDNTHVELYPILLDEAGARIQESVSEDNTINYKHAETVTLEVPLE